MKLQTVLRALLVALVTFEGLLDCVECQRLLKGHPKSSDSRRGHMHHPKSSDSKKGKVSSKKTHCTLRATIGVYPGYTGPLQASGHYEVSFYDDGYLAATFYGTGLEPGCLLCGVHIHNGTSCDAADLVGEHFYDEVSVGPDPWTATYGATYNSNTQGVSYAGYTINSGYGYHSNKGRTVVVHAQDGKTRYGCGILY